MKHPLARAIAKTNFLGAYGTCCGLNSEWRNVESVVHDMAHLVTLGLRLQAPEYLESTVSCHVHSWQAARAKENERMTIAVEFLFLGRVGAFDVADGFSGELAWFPEICRSTRITQKSVRALMLKPEAKCMAGSVYRRLAYHSGGLE